MNTYFNIHNHTMYSNIRLLDCINRPKDLIDKAIELGLSGIAITDHECLSAHMEVNQYAKKIKKDLFLQKILAFFGEFMLKYLLFQACVLKLVDKLDSKSSG